jgi:uncharacterized protein
MGKTALITGAGSGIGQELARLFAKDGYELILVDKDAESITQLAYGFKNQYGITATTLVKDLANEQAPDEIYAETAGKGHTVNVLVNNAGFGEFGMFATETDWAKEKELIHVNAVALVHLTKLFVKDMVDRHDGKIMLLGSVASVIPNPKMAVYGATKAFIKSFGEALRNELQGTGVSLSILMPPATTTNFFKTAGATEAVGADPNKTADPAMVAREGYMALMEGKDHVVAGWPNKLMIALANVLPDTLNARNARNAMMTREEASEQQHQQLVAIGVAAAVVGLFWLLGRNRREAIADGIDSARHSVDMARNKAMFAHKTGKAMHDTHSTLDDLTDTVSGAYRKARRVAEDVFA